MFDDLDAVVGERSDSRADKIAWNFLRLHKNRTLRQVARGPNDGDERANRQNEDEGNGKVERPPLEDVVKVLQPQGLL